MRDFGHSSSRVLCCVREAEHLHIGGKRCGKEQGLSCDRLPQGQSMRMQRMAVDFGKIRVIEKITGQGVTYM